MLRVVVLVALLVALWTRPSHSFEPDSRANLASRFSGYNFSSGLVLKEGERFLCPTTFLTSQRAILHERILTSILGGYQSVRKGFRPSLFIVVGATGSGKSFLINSLIKGKEQTCPLTQEDVGDFLFDSPKAMAPRSFPVRIPNGILSISGDQLMEKLPEYVSYQRWMDSRPKENQTIFIDVANSCHLEAAQLAQSVALTALDAHINLVFEGTGQRASFLFELANLGMENGYVVHLIHVNADLETCIKRAAKRFEETGRGVPFDIVKRSYLLSRRTFRQVATLAHYASVWRSGVCAQGFSTQTPGASFKKSPSPSKITL